MEDLADLHAAGRKLAARGRDVGDDQVEALGRARLGGRNAGAELDRGQRSGRGELHDPKPVLECEVGVESPPEARVEGFRSIDIGDRNDDCLELQVDLTRVAACSRPLRSSVVLTITSLGLCCSYVGCVALNNQRGAVASPSDQRNPLVHTLVFCTPAGPGLLRQVPVS